MKFLTRDAKKRSQEPRKGRSIIKCLMREQEYVCQNSCLSSLSSLSKEHQAVSSNVSVVKKEDGDWKETLGDGGLLRTCAALPPADRSKQTRVAACTDLLLYQYSAQGR